MASEKHQFIMDCIIRKMRYLGYEPVCVDGKSTLVSSLKIPPKIIRHRPDIIGVNIQNRLCIGEAKTENDVLSKRTHEQIIDYQAVGACTILACPQTSFTYLENFVNRSIKETDDVILMRISNELMPNEEI